MIPRGLILFLLLIGTAWGEAAIDPSLHVEDRSVAGNARQKYFLIERAPKGEASTPPGNLGLLCILPGGDGSADFLPFCANVLVRYGLPADYLAVELVAPKWRDDTDRLVWPSEIFRDPKAEFTTERFLQAVIQEVKKTRHLDEARIFTLGWSSSGHAIYSAAHQIPEVKGSIAAMSRFFPTPGFAPESVKGRRYYLYHSPDDTVCPFTDAQLAEKTLTELGASVKLVKYPGGHGWVPNTFYADRIREGIEWLAATPK